ncbi:MAG: hypothetical protein R3B95_20075 [Nitrospirales bacterium]|nr:hypothetical protein [Nitrospirales bacterium]
MVLCVGAQYSGKTTFLARLGEMFRNGSFSSYQFAGSLTLCAFERASWLATFTSGVPQPDTQRTSRKENDTFYHLRVHPKDKINDQLDLLISDLAGETFPTAVASREYCANISALSRADHLVAFLDGAMLVDRSRRHPELNNTREFLQQVRSVKHQITDLRVQVVFSRWDFITSSQERSLHEKFCEEIESDFRRRFADSFGALDFVRIAARPNDGSKPTNDKIQWLFAQWLNPPVHQTQSPAVRIRQPLRDFSAFGLK